MSFDIVIGNATQPTTGFDIAIGDESGGALLDFTLPAAITGTVFLVVLVRDGAVICNGDGWTQVTDGVGASGILLDAWVRAVDGTTGSIAGEVISFYSATEQELQGGLINVVNATAADLVYAVEHAAFTADTAPPAPSIEALQAFDSILCVWSADAAVALTPPTGLTEIDTYGSSEAVDRTILIAARDALAIDEIIPGAATASPAATGRAFTLALHHDFEPPGPTLDEMQAGNVSSLYVAAIEGYAKLLTGGDTDAASVAWEDTGYESAIGGLFVRHNPSQTIDPWNPFANTGGRLTLQVVTDSFGVDTHIKSGGSETQATASIDCNDTSVTVASAASFGASGTIYMGTEAATYSAKTGTSFTGLSRGKYSPFLTESATDFGHPHTITQDDPTTIAIPPIVSSTPRSWIGKWVGLWRHLEGPTGLLNTKDDALCVFAGRISEVSDNPATMTTDVECEHVLEYARDAVIGENPWQCTVPEGITLVAGATLARAFDISGVTPKQADPLLVVTGAPANNYQVKAGRYQVSQVVGIINTWLAQALADGDLSGFYKFTFSGNPDGLTHGKFVYRMSTTGTVVIGLNWTIHRALGKFQGATGAEFFEQVITRSITDDNYTYTEDSVGTALRSVGEATRLIEDEFGSFYDQSATLPNDLLALVPGGLTGSVGLCMLNDTQPVIITLNGQTLESVTGFDPATGTQIFDVLDVPWDSPSETKLRQIYIIRNTLANVIKQIYHSTGTASYNSTFDVLPAILGIGIPAEILGAEFNDSVDRLPHAGQEISILIDRPKKLVDILGGALKLRLAFPRWINGHMEFFSWMTPTTGDTLQESNKASPEGNVDEQRSASRLSSKWARNVIKIDYDRDFTIADSGNVDFRSHKTIIDRSAIDDAGGRKLTETIPDPTSFTSSFLGGNGSLDAVITDFVATVPMFTRPVRTSVRTIAPTWFEGYSVGDSITVTDAFARDPDTGARGVASRPGLIVAHSYEPGGFTPDGSVTDMHGEVEILFLDLLRIGPYVPFANVSSYTAGTATLTCTAHDGSETGEGADASWMPAGTKVRILQRDPANPASPLSWDRIVSSQSGNDIILTVALSSPTYDSALAYRVIWDDYPDAIAAQQVYSYQADDADYLISDTRVPYQYTTNTQLKDTVTATVNASDDPVELPPNSIYGDGVGLDVGHQQALNRLANNIYDYKTAVSAPILFQTPISVSKHANDEWEMVVCVPIFLGFDGLTNLVRRKLYVAPMIKTSSGATTINARITLSKVPPTGSTFLDVVFAAPSSSVSYSTNSTTYVTSATQGISVGPIVDFFGTVYLTLEMQVPDLVVTASCRGIATAYLGPRE